LKNAVATKTNGSFAVEEHTTVAIVGRMLGLLDGPRVVVRVAVQTGL
jgi:hypothetical protein